MKLKQTGRSMIEMLGVLAIIGTLSIGGMMMYRRMVNRHEANEIAHDANLIATLILTTNQMESLEVDSELSFSEYKKLQSGHTFTSYKETPDIFSVNAANVSKGVCKQILNSFEVGDLIIGVNQEYYSDSMEETECADENTMNFYYNPNNLPKCGKKICYEGKMCIDKECRCPDHMTVQNGKCACVPEYPNKCGYDCYPACAKGTEFDCGSKTCVCAESTHERALVDGKCVCPSGMQEGADGKCHTKACRNGTAGKQDWTCYIDDQRCGELCTENGLNCYHGVCDIGLCANGTTHAYHAGQNLYGCQNAQGVTCMYQADRQSVVFCYHPTDPQNACGNSCALTGSLAGVCNYGLCDSSVCPEGTEYGPMYTGAGYGSPNGAPPYSCRTNKISCTKSQGDIICSTPNHVTCGRGCTYDGHCTGDPNFCPNDDCKNSEDPNCVECPDWQIRDTTTGECVNVCPAGTTHSVSGSYHRCTRTDGVYCHLASNNSVYCFLPKGKGCGNNCQLNGTCIQGTCDASDCPNNLTHQYITSAYAGCYNPSNGVACYPTNLARTRWQCSQNGTTCAGTCDNYYGNGCCQTFTCPAGTTSTTYTYPNTQEVYDACYSPIHRTTCLDSKNCYREGVICGTGCNLDGTGCSTSKKCVESECGTGKTLVLQNGEWWCQDIVLSCSAGTCTINGSRCGTGCSSEGRNCSYGMCSDMDCPNGTYLAKVDTNTYGCKNPEGIVCYSENGQYTCSKNGTVCGTGCYNFDEYAAYGCGGCN